MGEDRGWVHLHYTTTSHWTGEKTHHDYRVELALRCSPLGSPLGCVCPGAGIVVTKLYQPSGSGTFASRKPIALSARVPNLLDFAIEGGPTHALERVDGISNAAVRSETVPALQCLGDSPIMRPPSRLRCPPPLRPEALPTLMLSTWQLHNHSVAHGIRPAARLGLWQRDSLEDCSGLTGEILGTGRREFIGCLEWIELADGAPQKPQQGFQVRLSTIGAAHHQCKRCQLRPRLAWVGAFILDEVAKAHRGDRIGPEGLGWSSLGQKHLMAGEQDVEVVDFTPVIRPVRHDRDAIDPLFDRDQEVIEEDDMHGGRYRSRCGG
jgi:hypothetical protein